MDEKSTKKSITIKEPFYVKGKWYSITLNPSDKYQYVGHTQRLIKVQNMLNELMLALRADKIHYRYSIDISEPREVVTTSIGPRIHLHGRIFFQTRKSIEMWLVKHMYDISRTCYLNIDTCDDIEIWDRYSDKYNHILNNKSQASYDEQKVLVLSEKNKKNIENLKSKPIVYNARRKIDIVQAPSVEHETSEASSEDSESESSL